MALMTEGVVRENRGKSPDPMMRGRIYRHALDQHGRRWGAEVDKRTDDPCGPIKALFAAPWIPDLKYIKWEHNAEEGRFAVRIDYAGAKADRRDALKEWTKNLLQVGAQLNGQAFDPQNPTWAVLQKVGPKPQPVEIVIAAERGDPWILGLTDEMPHWAVPFFAATADDEAAFLLAGTAAGDEDPKPARARRGRRPGVTESDTAA